MSQSALVGLMAILGGFLLVLFIIGIALYVLYSLGLYTLAKNKGIENPWLAWIPVANLYIEAKIIKSLSIGGWEIPNLELVLPLSIVAAWIGPFIPIIGCLIPIAVAVLLIIAQYKLFKIYRPENAVLFTVLSIILGFLGPIFVFMIRNDMPSETPTETPINL